MIHLIGPGAAGKSTTGRLLARRLGVACVDLDEVYLAQAALCGSDIGWDITREGYAACVRRNVDLYLLLVASADDSVIVTSSGFMVYEPDLHPAVADVQRSIVADPRTILLLPASGNLPAFARPWRGRWRDPICVGPPQARMRP